MQRYVARKGDRYYAVTYEGTDPITGRERRRWHPASTDLNDAERLATDLARRGHDDGHEQSSLTVAVYLAQRWLPSKKLTLRASTYDSYRRNIDLHIMNSIGTGTAPSSPSRSPGTALRQTRRPRPRQRHRRPQPPDDRRDPHDLRRALDEEIVAGVSQRSADKVVLRPVSPERPLLPKLLVRALEHR